MIIDRLAEKVIEINTASLTDIRRYKERQQKADNDTKRDTQRIIVSVPTYRENGERTAKALFLTAGARDNNTVISMKYGAVKSTTDSRVTVRLMDD